MTRTLALTMLVKDCAENLEALLAEIAQYFDQCIFVLGGKSRDGTARIARKYGEAIPFEWCDDYAAARNAGLEHVKTDFWFWVDGDDRVRNADKLPDLVQLMDFRSLGRLDLPYEYAYDEYGRPSVVHTRERLLRTSLGWRWEDRIHEHAWTDAPHQIGLEQGVVIEHRRREAANLDERLRLLKLMEAKDEGKRARRTMLLGDVYASLSDWPNALEHYAAYPAAEGSDVEHWHCCLMASHALLKMERPVEAHSWAMIAADMAPQFREGWLMMAMSSWDMERDSVRVLEFCRLAEQAEPCPMLTFRADEEFQNNLWDTQYRAYAQAGEWENAAEVTSKAAERWPKSSAWQEIFAVCVEELRRHKAVNALAALTDYMLRRQDAEGAERLLNAVPAPLEEDRRIKTLRQAVDTRLAVIREPAVYDRFYQCEHTYCDEWLNDHPFARWAWVIERLKKAGAKTIGEIGCAGGEFCIHAARTGLNVVGADVSKPSLALAQRRAQEQGLAERCLFLEAALSDLPGTGWRFDAVTCMELLEHLPAGELTKALDWLSSVSDHIFITVPAEYVSHAPGLSDKAYVAAHVREFTIDRLRRLIGTERTIINLFRLGDKNVKDTAFGNFIAEVECQPAQTERRAAFYLGNSPEYWEPSQVETTGLGGSETAVVRMAQELCDRGYAVTVFAEANGVWDGVEYLPHDRLSRQQHYELFVSSRRPALPIVPDADHIWLWEHDVGYPELTEERAQGFERVLVLSDWHRNFTEQGWPFLNGKATVTANGITPELFSAHRRRQRHRFVYCSSPDRGLDVLLGWWPAIRDMWPDAELHAYYGWQYFDSNDADAQAKAWKEKVAGLLDQPGVHWHGRIGQEELAREMARAQFWLYPSFHRTGVDWLETFCITALEAQAGGCIPITRPVGALPERLLFPKECLVEGLEVGPFLERLRWWDALCPDELRQRRAAMRAFALKHTWARVADGWLSELKQPQS